MDAAIAKIVESGILGALLVVSVSLNVFQARSNSAEKDKRIEDSKDINRTIIPAIIELQKSVEALNDKLIIQSRTGRDDR